MTRLRGLTPGDLDDAQRPVYESIAGGDRAKDASFPLTDSTGALVGPFNSLLYSPSVGDAVQQLGTALRFGCGLSAPVREIAILVVATHHDCEFERWAHEPIARRVGLTDDQIAALRAGTRPTFDSVALGTTYELCADTVAGGPVSNSVYDAAVDHLGDAGVFELVTVLGYYGLLAQLMTVFEIGTPD